MLLGAGPTVPKWSATPASSSSSCIVGKRRAPSASRRPMPSILMPSWYGLPMCVSFVIAIVPSERPGGGVNVVNVPVISGDDGRCVVANDGTARTPFERHSKRYARPGSRPSTITWW